MKEEERFKQNEKPGIGMIFFMVIFLGGIGYLVFYFAYGIWGSFAYHTVISVEDAGHIKGASYTSSSWGGSTSAIQTEKGTFLVRGALQAINGHQVRIEHRGNGSRALCEVETNECYKLLDW